MSDHLTWLQQWYLEHCDGDWEHSYGVKLETLDNPGWHLSIDVADTELDGREFSELRLERSETDWLHAILVDRKLHVHCGALNLTEAIGVFRRWTEAPETLGQGPPPSPHSVE